MEEPRPTKGGAILGLFTGIAEAVASGLAASKPPEEGCNTCPDDASPRRSKRHRPSKKARRGYRRKR